MKTILIIDDEELILDTFSTYLSEKGFEVLTADNGEKGIKLYEECSPDCILVDLKMPGLSGRDVITSISKRDDETPLIVISGNSVISDALDAIRNGAWDYLLKPVRKLESLVHTINQAIEKRDLILKTRGHQKILEELVEKRTQELKEKNRFLSNTMLNTILVLTQTIEAKDPYTRGHCLRVSNFCVEIARAYGLSKKSLKNLRIGSILHDIGKIGIPGNILNKPGRLDDKEFEIIKKHPVIGENILKNVEYYNPVIPIVRHHHERYDGKGYPDNITNSGMSPEIAAISVADTYDAITSSRPYRKAIPEEKALSILNEVKGTQLHPDMVDIFIENKLYKKEHKNLMQIDFNF